MKKGEWKALYSLRDDTSIIIKEADKGSSVVVWDREEYLAEDKKQLEDKGICQNLENMLKAYLTKL